jgi:hypothetical protein
MQCINCGGEASLVFKTTGVDDQPYCARHLPSAYRGTEYVTPAPVEEAADAAEFEVKDTPRRTRRRKADEGE